MKRYFPLISLFVLGCAVLGLNACGGNEPEQHKTNLTITPEGGTISLKNGVTIVVPSGAVNSNTEVTVEYLEDLDESTGSLPSDVQGLVKFTPEGLVFNKPIQVTIPLNQPVAERTNIVYWSADDGRWYITDRGEVNGKELQFYIEHFSTYASMGGAWGDLFSMMDAKVGGAQTQAEVNGALNSFLADNMWEEMGMKDFHWSTRAEMGGGAVSTCAQCCGLFASWMSQEGGNDRQGAARYKEQSTHNIVTNIALSNAAMSAHLKSEYQVAADRIIEIYGEPCPAALSGQAAKSTIEKGKTTEVTITASCDGSPLAGQLLEFSCSPELSCQTRNQRTDGNGQVTITVKGEEEGTGTVYVKALNAMDNAYDSETTVSINVGNGERWRITLDINNRVSTSWAEDNDGGGIYDENYKYEGGDQSIEYAYTIVYDVTIQDAGVGVSGAGKVTGKCSVTNHPDKFRLTAPAFSQSGQYTVMDMTFKSSSSQSALSASPEFKNLSDVPLIGSCYNKDGGRLFGLLSGASSYEDIGGYETIIDIMYKYAFLYPNVSGTWSWQEDESSDNGTYYFGNVPFDEGDNYHGTSFASLYSTVEIKDLKEMDTPFQFTDDYVGGTVDVEIGDAKFGLFDELYIAIGHYTQGRPGYWSGHGHISCSGTLKVERLDNKE